MFICCEATLVAAAGAKNVQSEFNGVENGGGGEKEREGERNPIFLCIYRARSKGGPQVW